MTQVGAVPPPDETPPHWRHADTWSRVHPCCTKPLLRAVHAVLLRLWIFTCATGWLYQSPLFRQLCCVAVGARRLQATDVVRGADDTPRGPPTGEAESGASLPEPGFLGPGLGASRVAPALGFAWSNCVNTRYGSGCWAGVWGQVHSPAQPRPHARAPPAPACRTRSCSLRSALQPLSPRGSSATPPWSPLSSQGAADVAGHGGPAAERSPHRGLGGPCHSGAAGGVLPLGPLCAVPVRHHQCGAGGCGRPRVTRLSRGCSSVGALVGRRVGCVCEPSCVHWTPASRCSLV
jgi:hypothetical protein